MPHGKAQLMFMCPSLNVALIETPPSINLQQDIVCIHNIVIHVLHFPPHI